MESNKTDHSGPDQQAPPARTLDRVSHFFLSQTERAFREKYRDGFEGVPEAPPASPASAIILPPSRPLAREHLLSLLREQPAVLQEGMKVIDGNLPCETPGDIELVALDSTNQLAVIDVDDKANDSLLLRGLAHVDWVIRNFPLLRRMYQDQVINFSLGPRLFLVAPGFSPLFRCALSQIEQLQIDCLKYYTIGLPGGTGLFCERLFGSGQGVV